LREHHEHHECYEEMFGQAEAALDARFRTVPMADDHACLYIPSKAMSRALVHLAVSRHTDVESSRDAAVFRRR